VSVKFSRESYYYAASLGIALSTNRKNRVLRAPATTLRCDLILLSSRGPILAVDGFPETFSALRKRGRQAHGFFGPDRRDHDLLDLSDAFVGFG
jgi:hypothetical protein